MPASSVTGLPTPKAAPTIMALMIPDNIPPNMAPVIASILRSFFFCRSYSLF